jgi:glycolate oxidase
MSRPSFIESHIGKPFGDFVQLSPEQRASVIRSAVPDLHFFFDEGRELEARDAPARSRELARSLHDAIVAGAHGADDPTLRALRERIVTDALLRGEADRDQNVYLGKLFTRSLTHAVPDVIFQPTTAHEVSVALTWARRHGVPITQRGAASTAMGGSVPNDAGLTMDLSRLDTIEVDAGGNVCVVGAGARLRTIHAKLAERGLALKVYPSNLGGTLAGWFLTGGIGLNAFGNGVALDSVRVADVVLPNGEHVRFHDDGRLDAPGEGSHRLTLTREQRDAWFTERGYTPLQLRDLAGSEGVFGTIVHLTVAVEPRPEIGAFLLSFARREEALAAVAWIQREAGNLLPKPANVKLFSGLHMHHTRRVWEDEDARAWHEAPGNLSSGAGLPWTRIASPAEVGVACAPDRAHADAYLFVDFPSLDHARRFGASLAEAPGTPIVLDRESVRVGVERFRPQQTKRLGPGLLAAEILLPPSRVPDFLPRAEAMARGIGMELDAEVYYLAEGTALVIAGYLTDHRRGSFAVDLTLAPALLDLAMRSFGGRPYVLGRWQSAYFDRKLGADAGRVRRARATFDASELVNRGVLTGLRLRGPLGALLAATFRPGIGLLSTVYGTPLTSWLARAVRGGLGIFGGPAAGRGGIARVGATHRARPPVEAASASGSVAASAADSILLAIPPRAVPAASAGEPVEDRALHCVNCGECNSVCPIFHESKIRLPQMLTHAGEAMRAGGTMSASASALLDLCMRCGNCEEVCQAGIPHLPLYEVMQRASDRVRPKDHERHAAIVAAVRGSQSYRRDFLDIRGGGYVKRTPVALAGVTRYLVLRSENDAGPAATCIHCGACVSVCPTHANREFEGLDPRWITTVQNRCIGCGTCVEICPANLANGGQTLRVMEAPTAAWFEALVEFPAEPAASPASHESGATR